MKKPHFSYSLLLLILISGCQSSDSTETTFGSENSIVHEKKVTLTDVGVRNFPLDEKTGFDSFSYRIDKYSDTEWFSFLNPRTNTLYVYDNKTGELLNTIKMEEEGPDGVGKLVIASHLMLADGGVLVFNTWLGTLFDIDSGGRLRKKYPIINYKIESSMSNPEPSQRAPLVRKGDDVYIVCSMETYQTDYSDTYVMMVYNLKEEKFRFIYTYPEIYNSGYWGPYFKYTPRFDYNDQSEEMVLSFPIDGQVYKMGLNGQEVSRHTASSDYITDMTPLRTDINYGIEKDHSVRDNEQREHAFTHSDYSGILYDKYRGLYYRIAYIRPSIDQYRSGRVIPDFSISIFDKGFSKMGEKKFDGLKYSLRLTLVSEEGLCIGRTDLYEADEDHLSMSIFELETL